MSLVINTNNIATIAAGNLHANQTALQKSLARLSSGSKIVTPSDDAGGLAVSTKIKAAINRNIRAQQNVDNAISFLQTQDGALKVATKVLDRISELKTMSLDPTKNSLDIATYNTEFKQLQQQLTNISKEQFNGIDLFNKFSDLTVHTTEDGVTGTVNASRGGLFEDLNTAELSQRAIGSVYAGTDGTDYTTLTLTTPTHGLTATVILADGLVTGSVNGSDISSAIKGINDALVAANITSLTASEDSDGKLLITGSETFTIAETISGAYGGTGLSDDLVGTVKTYDGVAKTYDYNALADYRVGDVVTGERSDGSVESFVIQDSAVTGNGRTFDQFAALANTLRLDKNLDPNAKVFVDGTTSYTAGEVLYHDEDGRYYLSRGDGTYANSNSADIDAATGKTEFLDLGTSLPGLLDYADYSAGTAYYKDDIVSYDGNLYVATTSISEAEGSPLDNNAATPPAWIKLSVSVSGAQSIMDLDNDLADFSIADIRAMIQTSATVRAQNGAEMSRLEVSNEMLKTNHTNLEASNSRLEDVDVAAESTAFARANILVQSAAAMLAQANTVQSVALSLLQ
jgi:flagellin